jgi:hypothetical protein
MIKLEDLKIDDKVYGVCSDGLGVYAESIVKQELFMIDGFPNPYEGVWCTGGIEVLTRSYEQYIFRTEKEANDFFKKLQIKLAKELLNDNKFIYRLFECATSAKRLDRYSEVPIYKIAIDLLKSK